jgi:DNA-directed RNA polymerase specialized sigma subunit
MCYIEQNPLKANMVKRIEEYPYSSYHYFLDYDNIPECLKDAWVVQNYKDDIEAIEALLTSQADKKLLQELKTASSLVEAQNTDNRPKAEDLVKRFENVKEIKKRNTIIIQSYKEGYSQHMIAKVLGMAQSTINGIIKRYG